MPRIPEKVKLRLDYTEYSLTLASLIHIINKRGYQFDAIAATCNDAMPWACLLSEKLHMPFYTPLQNGKFYTFSKFEGLETRIPANCDHIAANTFSLPFGIHVAYALEKSILHIRTKAGENVSLMGTWSKGDSICLYEAYTDTMKSLTRKYTSLLEKERLKVSYPTGVPHIEPVSVINKRILLIDKMYVSKVKTPSLFAKNLKESGAIIAGTIKQSDIEYSLIS